MSPEPSFAGDEVASTIGSLSAFFGILPSQAGNDNIDWDFMISSLPKPLREGFLAGVFSADLFPIAFFATRLDDLILGDNFRPWVGIDFSFSHDFVAWSACDERFDWVFVTILLMGPSVKGTSANAFSVELLSSAEKFSSES